MKLALVAALAIAASSAVAQGFNFTFDSDAEGWQRGTHTAITTGAFSGAALWNSNGHLAGNDFANVATYFSPDLGSIDREGLYGGTFAWDFFTARTPNLGLPEVYLSDGTNVINADATYPVSTTFNSYSLALDTTGGWNSGLEGNTAASEAEIRSILKSLKYVGISGEIRSGSDFTGVDNVSAQAVPEPGLIAAAIAGGIMLRRRRKA